VICIYAAVADVNNGMECTNEMLCGVDVLVVSVRGDELSVHRDSEGLECADDIMEQREAQIPMLLGDGVAHDLRV
jgi:hypothetical protein